MLNQDITDALERLHKDLDQLAPAIEHVRIASETTKMVSEIPKEHQRLLGQIKDAQLDFSNRVLTDTQSQVSGVIASIENLISKSEISRAEQHGMVERIQSHSDKINDYQDRIHRIDFPSRLNSIETNLGSLLGFLNNIQGQLNIIHSDLNRNQDVIKTMVADNSKLQMEEISKLNRAVGVNKTLLVVAIALSIIGSVASILIK